MTVEDNENNDKIERKIYVRYGMESKLFLQMMFRIM